MTILMADGPICHDKQQLCVCTQPAHKHVSWAQRETHVVYECTTITVVHKHTYRS